ncbi:immunoglobulin superfamily member 1-like isoform X2 [Pyxicephalus adspersus]|uniref:immunoglobulin superfamily member 1-like isoform X2 n=1 Tax=Pyxicephalus adspersus TaxID=30357 RepID=UPI003B58FF91
MMSTLTVIRFGLFFLVSHSLARADIVQLDVLPNHPIYELGENLSFTCCSDDPVSSKIFEFYKEESKMYSTEQIKNCAHFGIEIRSKQDAGQFQCLYRTLENGTYIQSNISIFITIHIADTPQPPSIALSPLHPVYLKEESFTLTCLPLVGTSAKRIQIYHENKIIQEGGPLQSYYNISAANENTSGKYACKYWIEINGRNIGSSLSDYVIVNVTETPPPPSIGLIPSYTVYTKQETFKLNCSPPISAPAKGIQIYFEGKIIQEGELLHTGLISASNQDAPGNYSCKYWVEISGRRIYSSQSDHVIVNVTETPPPPSIGLIPSYTVYTKQESFKLNCSPPISAPAKGIQIYFEGKIIQEGELLHTGLISASNQDAPGNYPCKYWVEISGRRIYSSQSDHVIVNVTEAPGAPKLVLVPDYQFYVRGETLQILCMAGSNAQYITLYKNGQLLLKSPSLAELLRYSVPSLNHGDSGNYICMNQRNVKGRSLESSTSHPLNVIEPLPAPNLTMGYSIEKTNDGFHVTLNCSAPDFDLMRTFYIIEASDKHSERNVTDYSASVKLELGNVNYATFYCEYEEEIQTRKIRSKRSQTLTIPLAEPSLLSPPIVAGVIGVVSLLICLALILLFYMKFKRQYKTKRFRFSLYWKTPKKAPEQHILNNLRSKEEVNENQEKLEEVSRNPTRLSITTGKVDDEDDIALNFCTFRNESGHRDNPATDLSSFQNQPGQRENLPTSDLDVAQPRPSEAPLPSNCVWNYTYL